MTIGSALFSLQRTSTDLSSYLFFSLAPSMEMEKKNCYYVFADDVFPLTLEKKMCMDQNKLKCGNTALKFKCLC